MTTKFECHDCEMTSYVDGTLLIHWDNERLKSEKLRHDNAVVKNNKIIIENKKLYTDAMTEVDSYNNRHLFERKLVRKVGYFYNRYEVTTFFGNVLTTICEIGTVNVPLYNLGGYRYVKCPQCGFRRYLPVEEKDIIVDESCI